MRLLAACALVPVLVGCGGDATIVIDRAPQSRDCFVLWNAPGNEENRAQVALTEFRVARVGPFFQTAGYGSSENGPGAEREGCSYLFHSYDRYLTIAGMWEGDELRWGVPPTISGPWTPEQQANSDDNANVAPDGTVRRRSSPTPPSDPPPTAGPLEPPPPAWIETSRGSFWLGYSTFCWRSGCADYGALTSCSDSGQVPHLTVSRGEIVHAHLGFTPRRVMLVTFAGGSSPPAEIDHRLLPTPENVVWRVDRGGPFTLTAVAKADEGGGDASYVACLELVEG